MREFDYEFALRPHQGSWTSEHLWQEAFNFNLPLIISPITQHIQKEKISPIKALAGGFFYIDAPNVQVGAIKPSEWCGSVFNTNPEHRIWTWDHNSVIIRVVEMEGKTTKCLLSLLNDWTIQKVEEVNLLEMQPKTMKLDHISPQISFELKKYEIKTFRIILKQKR